MNLGLEGKVALITGASKGIGRGIASALAAEGAQVALTSRSADRAAEAAEQLGAAARGYGFDSSDLDAIDPLLDDVRADLGEPDIYIANTGGPPTGDPMGFSREQWETAHRTLVMSPLTVVERLLPTMRRRGFGRVVAIGSSDRDRAAGLPAALQRASAGTRRCVQGARSPGRGRRRHAQPRPSGTDLDRPHRRRARVGRGGGRTREGRRSRRAGSARWTSWPRWSPSCAPEQASYITGTAVLVDGRARGEQYERSESPCGTSE